MSKQDSLNSIDSIAIYIVEHRKSLHRCFYALIILVVLFFVLLYSAVEAHKADIRIRNTEEIIRKFELLQNLDWKIRENAEILDAFKTDIIAQYRRYVHDSNGTGNVLQVVESNMVTEFVLDEIIENYWLFVDEYLDSPPLSDRPLIDYSDSIHYLINHDPSSLRFEWAYDNTAPFPPRKHMRRMLSQIKDQNVRSLNDQFFFIDFVYANDHSELHRLLLEVEIEIGNTGFAVWQTRYLSSFCPDSSRVSCRLSEIKENLSREKHPSGNVNSDEYISIPYVNFKLGIDYFLAFSSPMLTILILFFVNYACNWQWLLSTAILRNSDSHALEGRLYFTSLDPLFRLFADNESEVSSDEGGTAFNRGIAVIRETMNGVKLAIVSLIIIAVPIYQFILVNSGLSYKSSWLVYMLWFSFGLSSVFLVYLYVDLFAISKTSENRVLEQPREVDSDLGK